MQSTRGSVWLALVGGMLVPACTAGPATSAEELRDQLGQAGPGDTVRLADGTFEGSFTIPAGVTLEAEHAGQAIISSSAPGPVLRVRTGAGSTTRLSGPRIVSSADVGVLVLDQGAFEAEQVQVACKRGIGMAAEGLASVALDQVTFTGSITAEKIPGLFFPLSGAKEAIVGLVLSKVTQATLVQVSAERFGGFGAVLVSSSVSWTGGSVSRNVGVGLIVDGGQVTTSDLKVEQNEPGQRGQAILAFGIVLAGKAALNTKALSLARNKGLGLLQHDARSTHSDLKLTANSDVGIWVQASPGTPGQSVLKLEGIGTELKGNKGGGIFSLESGLVELKSAVIASSEAMPQSAFDPATGQFGTATMADGIQIVDTKGGVRLEQVTLTDNSRVGVLCSGTLPGGAKLELVGGAIKGSGSYGLIAQEGCQASLSAGFARDANLEQKDKGLTTALAEAVTRTAVPGVGLIRQGGLVGDKGLLSNQGTLSPKAGVGTKGLPPDPDP